MARLTRREFLERTSAAAGSAMLGAGRPAAGKATAAPPAASRHATRLTTGWQYSRGGLGGAWEARANARDARSWEDVQIPHCVNALDALDLDVRAYQGKSTYRTTVTVDNPFPDGRTLLHFEGAGQRCTVYVFTEKVAAHDGGYDEFWVDITAAVTAYRARPDGGGAVPIVVVCDNARDPETIPSALADFSAYGGLYRHVNLVYVPAVSLGGLHIDATLEKTGTAASAAITVRAGLRNADEAPLPLTLSVRVTDPQGTVVHESRESLPAWPAVRDVAAFTLKAPALWSPRAPRLYTCTVSVSSPGGEDALTERFGVRSFEFVPKGPFKLNGERLFLRGTHRHEDHAGLGSALTDELTRRELGLIKEMGVNFIRLAHYQQSRLVLDLCDELGILVWEEIPWCRGSLTGELSQDRARTALSRMIDQHRNHPSIILWGVGNEVGWPEEAGDFDREGIRDMVRQLADLARSLDPSRKIALRRTDYCADLVDVFAPSIWAGWYSGRYTEYKASAEKLVRETGAHVFHAEWGGDSHAGRHAEDPDKVLASLVSGEGVAERGLDYLLTGGQARASRDGDWSETYICNLFDWHLKEQETMQEWFTGSAQWIFKDFHTPQRPDNPVPLVNQKGVAERDLTLKEGYYVFQSYWSETPMVRLYSHTWPVRWGAKGEGKLVKVYSNCPAVELFVNGISCGMRKRNSQDFPAAGLRWVVPFAEGRNRLRAVGIRDGRKVVDEIEVEYRTEPWDAPARLRLAETARDGRDVTVEVTAVDARGTACLDSRLAVRFDLAGDGRLIANLGTASGSRTVQLANGRARIRARLGAQAAVMGVSSAGLPTTFLELKPA